MPASPEQIAAAALRDVEVTRVLDRLASEGVDVLLLKGAHLAHSIYANPALRPRTDTDLLIRAEARSAVRQVFEAAGYRLVPHVTGRFVMSQCHFGREEPPGFLHAYDVHWKIANPPLFSDLLTFDEIAADSVPVPALGPHARGPSKVHALLVACIHRVAHHQAGRMIWLYDIHLLSEALSADERARVVDLAGRKGILQICASLAGLAQASFGGSGSGQFSTACARACQGRPRERSADYLIGPRSKASLLWLDLRALSQWQDRLTLLREHLFPPPAYMAQSHGAAGIAGLPLAYTARILRGMRKWLRA